jgi:hypothetical protein
MLGTKLVLSTALTAALLSLACAHTPNALNTDEAVLMMREDYVRTHPGGKYNEYIQRGQVVRGMNYLEVSASWGIPETRSKSRDRKVEYWTFFGKDDLSGDWTRYTMVFEKGVLADWELSKHFTKNGTLTHWRVPGNEPATDQVGSLNNGTESGTKR